MVAPIPEDLLYICTRAYNSSRQGGQTEGGKALAPPSVAPSPPPGDPPEGGGLEEALLKGQKEEVHAECFEQFGGPRFWAPKGENRVSIL